MKIHIIGGSGSGKSHLAETLSAKYGIPHYDLDQLQWDSSGAYGQKRAPEERRRLLDEILEKPDWVIEGVYHSWCLRCFEEADMIYLLSVPRYKYRYRILRRFARRKLGLEKGKKESLRSVAELLKWADRYQEKDAGNTEYTCAVFVQGGRALRVEIYPAVTLWACRCAFPAAAASSPALRTPGKPAVQRILPTAH